jgi:hypothetical protein
MKKIFKRMISSSNRALKQFKKGTQMMMRELMPSTGEGLGLGFAMRQFESAKSIARGDVIIDLYDENDNLIESCTKKNLIVLDASLLVARLCKDPLEPPHGIFMLAVGTGASGAILNPDAPDEKQRRLNNEIERKTFSSTTFRDANGIAVSYPTKVVDFTTEFLPSEAVGPLNEMGLISPLSSNPLVTNPNPNTFPTYDPTVDVTNYDILVNYLTFSVISKPNTARMVVTWRLTF